MAQHDAFGAVRSQLEHAHENQGAKDRRKERRRQKEHSDEQESNNANRRPTRGRSQAQEHRAVPGRKDAKEAQAKASRVGEGWDVTRNHSCFGAGLISRATSSGRGESF